MIDEIKKVEEEAVKVEPSSPLSEPALDEIVGGTTGTLPKRPKPIDITLKRG
jgi:hypothetical protein